MKRIPIIASLALAWGAAAFGQAPAITAVQDSATNTANIAQGSIFVVKGTNLSGAGYVAATVPLPTTIPGTGVKITFTPAGGSTGTDAYMFYTYNQGGVNQLAALVPSKLAPGSYNVTVTYNGAMSAPFQTTIVAHKFGLFTSDGTGTGLAVLQDYISQTQYDVNRFTTFQLPPSYTFSPAHPGQVVIAWGTGLGAIPGDDSTAPGAIDFRGQDVKVLIGNKTIALAAGDASTYAGRAPTLPGTDQLVFALPSDIQTGCTVPFQVSVGGQLSNSTTIAIAPAGANACVIPGISTDVLTNLDNGGSFTAGNFELTQFNTKMSEPGIGTVTALIESAAGAFTKYTGAQLVNATVFLNPTGACQVFHRVGDQSALIFGPTASNLDAGAIALTGPNSLNKQLTKSSDNGYSLSLGMSLSGITLPPGVTLPGFNTTPVITQGTYTLNGAGGADVGKFTANVTVGQPLTLSPDLPATVTRSQNLPISWSGGNASDTVAIIGMSGSTSGGSATNPIYDASVFICTTTAGAKTFTVPSTVLQQLPATPASATAGTGALMVMSATQPSSTSGIFTAPLVKGGSIDSGIFQGIVGFLSTTAYQ